jgi:hypothetical protein
MTAVACEHEASQDEDQIALHPAEPDVADRLAADHRESANDDDRADKPRRRDALTEQRGREEQPTERRAGRLDQAAMPQRDEQKAGIADQRKHRSAQHHQRQPASPSDPAEIFHARTQDEWQEGEARPNVAVHQQINGRQSGPEPVPGRGKAQRPAKGRANAAGDPEEG